MGTESQIQDAIGTGFLVMDKLREAGAIEFANFLSRYEDFVDIVGTFKGPRAASALSGMASVRSGYNNASNSGPQWLAPLLREYAYVLDFPDKDMVRIMQALYADYVLTGKRVKSRGFTYGTVTAGATPVGNPVGDGVIYRLTKDENGFDIENTFVQTITMECVNDQNNGGVKFKESFRFRGGAANIDNILIAGSDSDQTYQGISSDDSASYFQNCSFSSMNGEATETTKFDGWTISDGTPANFTQDTTDYFQITPNDPVAACVVFSTNGKMEQAFSLANTQFSATSPMIVRAPWKIVGANAGAQVWLEFGEQVSKVDIGGAESGWQTTLKIELSDRSWYKKFAKNGGKLAISVHGLTAGTVKFDNIIVAPQINFDGLWYAPCAGQTPWKVGDNYYVTDICAEDAINQRNLVYETGIYLPHSRNVSDITWADSVPHT